MKKLVILSSLLGALFTVTSCRDEFLESHPTETLATPPAQAKLYGLYSMMINKGTGGTTSHDDFGQKGYDIYMDLLSSDMALAGVTYGYYDDIVNFNSTTDHTKLENYKAWRYYYRIIYAANDVIAGLGGNDATPTNKEDKYALAQAKAMRAYAYFYLMQLYTTKYEPTSTTNSIPLYIDASTDAKPKTQQSIIYNQMVKDLTEAVRDLDGYTRPNKGVINKHVAQGLLAYVYAAMDDYTKAATQAQAIIDSGVFPITSKEQTVYKDHNGSGVSSGGGFNDLTTPSWMWGFDITTNNNLDLVSWWGQVDVFTYSYAWAGDPKVMDEKLYSSIDNNDIRKEQFKPHNKIDYLPMNKFFHSDRKIGGQRSVTTDYLFMRVDEFYLLAAEVYAKSGNDSQARTLLKKLLDLRLPNTDYIDSLSGTKLQDEIYKQTRIELWGEGKSYLAMKRNKKSITRGSNHLFFQGETFNYDDSRLSLKIPQQEVNNNPNL